MVNADGVRFVGRDYNVLEFVDAPIGVGIATWSDEDEDFAPGLYAQMAMVSWEDVIRLNIGATFAWKESQGRLAVRPTTSLTYLIPTEDFNIEIGGYFAPFWNIDPRSDDPYGVMVGIAFNL